MSKRFISVEPSVSDYWRAVVLFGKNTASYKFALAKSLINFAEKQKTNISLDDIALEFSKNICMHLKKNDRQGTNPSNSFLDKCRAFNASEVTIGKLISATKKDGFRYVFDAFHNISGGKLPLEFYKNDTTNSGKIILHDNIFKLLETTNLNDLNDEVEARWSLVEIAWKLKLSNSVIALNYDRDGESFFESDKNRRTSITSARGSLNGYQKGHCFYCASEISIQSGNINLAEVDHFLPHMLGSVFPEINYDGVWNLVLACQDCNRGSGGKFEKIPEINLLERLYIRNTFLIESHHPLRETLILQTGKTDRARTAFLNKVYNMAETRVINKWSPETKKEPLF